MGWMVEDELVACLGIELLLEYCFSLLQNISLKDQVCDIWIWMFEKV